MPRQQVSAQFNRITELSALGAGDPARWSLARQIPSPSARVRVPLGPLLARCRDRSHQIAPELFCGVLCALCSYRFAGRICAGRALASRRRRGQEGGRCPPGLL